MRGLTGGREVGWKRILVDMGLEWKGIGKWETEKGAEFKGGGVMEVKHGESGVLSVIGGISG